MPSIYFLWVIFICAMTVGGCIGTIPESASDPRVSGAESLSDGRDVRAGDLFEILGTVIYEPMEGGFYAIRGDDGRAYDPVNLPEAFRREGLKVRIGARLHEGMASVHMYGVLIEVVSIAVQ